MLPRHAGQLRTRTGSSRSWHFVPPTQHGALQLVDHNCRSALPLSLAQDAALPLVEGLMPAVSKLLEKGRFPGGFV